MNERKHEILVALNELGENDIEFGNECESKNIAVFSMPQEEFDRFYFTYSDMLNEKFGTLIDEYENEEIPKDICKEVIEFLKDKVDLPIFFEALSKAIECNTFAMCYF